jgi:hypothetical protein
LLAQEHQALAPSYIIYFESAKKLRVNLLNCVYTIQHKTPNTTNEFIHILYFGISQH